MLELPAHPFAGGAVLEVPRVVPDLGVHRADADDPPLQPVANHLVLVPGDKDGVYRHGADLAAGRAGVERRYSTDLTDEQWEMIRPLVARERHMGRPTVIYLRGVVNAILYLNRTGCPWLLLPTDFPNWNTVRYYFDHRKLDGTFIRINDVLRERRSYAAGLPEAGGRCSRTSTGRERWIFLKSLTSSSPTSVTATPSLPARAVRPMRWT